VNLPPTVQLDPVSKPDSKQPIPGSGEAFRTVSGLGSGDVLETPSTVPVTECGISLDTAFLVTLLVSTTSESVQ